MWLIEHLPLPLCNIDQAGIIIASNRQLARVTGLDRVQLDGQDWCAVFAAERRDDVHTLWATARSAPRASQLESSRAGRRLRWTFSAWENAVAGELCASCEDVTALRNELARSRTRDRVTTLGNLGAGLAHELRNPLNSAHLQLQLLSRKLTRQPELRALHTHAEAAGQEIGRAAALLEDFLAYARPDPYHPVPGDLGPVVLAAVQACRASALATGVSLVLEAVAPLHAEFDAGRIQVAVQNLVSNAIDAVRASSAGVVHVRYFARADSAVIEVADNGPGLASSDAPIFDPFFSTKADGTGLGLSIVERVAADHMGTINVERRDGRTVFCLALPRGSDLHATG
jgi:PAS domain S-box-containing protein